MRSAAIVSSKFFAGLPFYRDARSVPQFAMRAAQFRKGGARSDAFARGRIRML
jgi:hypothetical protein